MGYIDLTLEVKKTNRIYKKVANSKNRELQMGHVGTHFDVYGGMQVPLDYMLTRGVVFDVSSIRNRELTIDDIDIDYVKPGDFVLIRTGSIERSPYGSNNYFLNSTQFSLELIERLAKENIKYIGIDAPDLRRGYAAHIEADKLCLKYGVIVVENLVNLDKLPTQEDFKVMTSWLDDPDATGVKCRVVAITQE